MKTLKSFSTVKSILLAIITAGSCTLDPCENKLCLNGGFCEDGTCVCVNGYSGSNCQNEPPTPNPPCIINNSAELCITNASTVNKTYDILLDGVKIMTISPGQEKCAIVAAGRHLVQSFYTNTSTRACSDSSPVIVRCSKERLTCSG